jgi:transposase-like protein
LNNGIEQDYRAIKRIVKPMMEFKSFNNARKTLSGIEVMNMMRKGQVKEVERGDVTAQTAFVCQIFGVVA